MRSPHDIPASAGKVGYVLKMYPRFSETFVVNEILAHERAGLELEIFSLRLPSDGRFHEMLARVQAPVTYLPHGGLKAERFWNDIAETAGVLPRLMADLEEMRDEEVDDVHQAVLLAREVHARGITHLHAHFASVATTVARHAARLAGITYSFTAHAKDIFHEDVRAGDLYAKLRDARAVVTVSDHNRSGLAELCPPAADRIHRVYNGLDLERFPYADPTGRAPVIVSVGRLVEKKGFADLIDACALLAARGRAFSCRIAGSGPLEQELRVRIAAAGLEGRVELIGPRSQDAIRALVQDGAVFAAPCVIGSDGNRDGLPTVLLEAMALGTPCVSTPVTGIPEAVRHEETGILVGERDPAALAVSLEKLLDDAELRVRLARAARVLVEEEFDGDRAASRVRDLALRPVPVPT